MNWELFGLAHGNPDKFFNKIYQNNKKFIVNDIDHNNDKNIITFCNDVIKKHQQQLQDLKTKKSKSTLTENSDKKDGSMIDDDDHAKEMNDYDNHELNDNNTYGQIQDDICQLLKQLYDVPFDITKNILFLYLDNSTFWDTNLVKILDIIRMRQQQEQLENKDKSKTKTFVAASIHSEPMVFVVDLINSSVKDLQIQIQYETGIPCGQQKLFYVNTCHESGFEIRCNWKRLSLENRLLCDYNIPIGATIYCCVSK